MEKSDTYPTTKGGDNSGFHGGPSRHGRKGKVGGSSSEQKKSLVIMSDQDAQIEVQSFMDSLSSDDQDLVHKARSLMKQGISTKDANVYHGSYTPERKKIHEEIIAKFFAGKKPEPNPEIIFTGGLPASGKSSAIGDRFGNHVNIDADEVKKLIPEYKGWNAGLTHAESCDICEDIFRRAIKGKYNIIQDGTLRGEGLTSELLGASKQSGYKAKLIFVDVSLKTALGRMLARLKSTKRFVDPSFFAIVGSHPIQTMNKFKHAFDGYEVWDNNGEKPVLLESK